MTQLYAGAGLEVARFTATEAGYNLLERSEYLMAAVADFAICTHDRSERDHPEYNRPEHAFNSNVVGDGPTHLYTGEITETAMLDGVAVEMSTATSGRSRWKAGYSAAGSKQRSPLLRQMTVLNAIAGEVGTDRYENSVFVPEQLFALETYGGDRMVANVHPPGFITLIQWIKAHGKAEHNALGREFDPDKVLLDAAARVRKAVGNSQLGLALLGLLDGPSYHVGDTMLVAEYMPDPAESSIGIVRVPTTRRVASGFVVDRVARNHKSNSHLKKSPPIFERT